MAAEAAVCGSVWDGAIPVRVVLDSKEVAVSSPPDALYLMVRRMSLLPLLIPALAAHFHPSLPPGHDTVWLDFNGLPLKWNIWCGVLFDVLCPEQHLPWNLTVHFRSYPSDVLLPLDQTDTVPHTYMHALKQAVSVLQGSVKAVMQLSQADHAHLWTAVSSGDLESFQRLLSLLNVPLFLPPLSISSSPSLRALALHHSSRALTAPQAPRQPTSDPPLPPVPIRLLVRRGVLPAASPSPSAPPHHHCHGAAGTAIASVGATGGGGVVAEVGALRSWRDVEMCMRVVGGGHAEHAAGQAASAMEELTIGAALAAAVPQLASCFAPMPARAPAAAHHPSRSAAGSAARSEAELAGEWGGEAAGTRDDGDGGEEGRHEQQGGERELVGGRGGEEVQQAAEREGRACELGGHGSGTGGGSGDGGRGGESSSSGGETCPCVMVCQGVVIPPHTPLSWLAHNMVAPDLFLHICLLLP
ncbi:hypothetical protein CLOM_g11372 [Closterium sp. NIES-68]|nr:hypothetical protein CLOM_g11372 [Closterium sp. NIES-68]GJP58265.1 hypothetical protein CLOP_g22946 [Closterium sp. NIES-67]